MAVSYPAIRGKQGERDVFSFQLSFRDFVELTNFTQNELSNDVGKKIEEIKKNSQRELNQGAVKKIQKYIIEHDSFILPPIILIAKKKGSHAIDPEKIGLKFVPIENANEEGSPTQVGIITINQNITELLVQDGNHRAHAIKQLLADESIDMDYSHHSISVQLSPYEGAEKRQDDFSRLNTQIPVNRNLCAFYQDNSANDPLGAFVKHILENSVFNTLVRREGSINKKVFELFTYNDFRKAVLTSLKPIEKMLLETHSNTIYDLEQSGKSTRNVSILDQDAGKFAFDVWRFVGLQFADFNDLIQGEVSSQELRDVKTYNKSFIVSLGSMLKEILSQYVIEENTDFENFFNELKQMLAGLSTVEFSRSNPKFQEIGYIVTEQNEAGETVYLLNKKVGNKLSEYLFDVCLEAGESAEPESEETEETPFDELQETDDSEEPEVIVSDVAEENEPVISEVTEETPVIETPVIPF